MQLRSIKGSASVILMGAIPILMMIMAMVVWIGQITYSKIKLQIAADRAAYAGAAYVAHALNSIAVSNWKIHDAYTELKHDFESDTQQDQSAVNQRIQKYEQIKTKEFQTIDNISQSIDANATKIAVDLLGVNAPESFGDIYVNAAFELCEDCSPEEQWDKVSYNIVSGYNFIDPDDVDGGSYDALKYLIKKRAADASIAIVAQSHVEPIIMGNLFGGSVPVLTASAAKAYGGSIEKFAQKESDELSGAVAATDENGNDHLYRSATVPMSTIGAGEIVY